MKLIYLIIVILLIITISGFGQAIVIKGFVYGKEESKSEPLTGANVYWSNTSNGVITDNKGYFQLNKSGKDSILVVSFVGYKSDSLHISNDKSVLKVNLLSDKILQEVVIKGGEGGSYISEIKPIKTEVITTVGLQKLACCNLSESFENNPTVDVGYNDAVSGAKQIRMLGLAGIYSQLLVENLPAIRGLASPYGLSFVPGSWMSSIQISKGTSSVLNGYESITGQINVELKKPGSSEPLYINLYTNSDGRLEGNITSAIKLTKNMSTMVLLHGSTLKTKMDENHDSFLDLPMSNQINLISRWEYTKGINHTQFGFQYINEKREGGQNSYYDSHGDNNQAYGIDISTKRYQFFIKSGFRLNRPATSIAILSAVQRHEHNSFFGNKTYNASENSINSNVLLETYLGNTNHKISSGISFMGDKYDEVYNDIIMLRDELVPGVFGQYTYNATEKFALIAGIRADYHNIYGLLNTPRIHLKYKFNKGITLRGSAGKGYRSPNVIADNIGVLASSRVINISEKLKIEEAWNYGVNLTKEFELTGKRKVHIGIDLYRTDFVNQVILNIEHSGEAIFYNLKGKSFSNSFQTDAAIEVLKGFEITAAFRLNDVKATIDNSLQSIPFMSRYKGLFTASYTSRFEKWKFDFTSQFNGKSRLPNTSENPEKFRQEEYSKPYIMLYAQITKKFKYFDIYLGGENLTGFMQPNPIIDAQNPFSEYFDASIVWGPLTGRMYYAGLRFKIDN